VFTYKKIAQLRDCRTFVESSFQGQCDKCDGLLHV